VRALFLVRVLIFAHTLSGCRVHADMLDEDGVLAQVKHCHLVLDNTYCDPTCSFPSRHDALHQVIHKNLTTDHLPLAFKPYF
jgi:hypothetical protein